MKKTFSFIFILIPLITILAQPTQTIRGTIVDSESQFPLIGVTVSVIGQEGEQKGAVTDIDGDFRIENILVGRASVSISYLGYQEVNRNDLIINSAKEIILNISMQEVFTDLDVVVVTARQEGQVINEMATVSAREFSVQETNRYAGSRGEPARMASNFAGVQGADDSRNDIIIRGNSPQGVLWKLEGINIPNPNHFSIPGTGGGPVTILNNKFLSNSDFFTGAFPAEYGNGIAGVFDLKMRNGNNEKHEFSGQLGFLGTELMAEGPLLQKSKSSYLVTYRYSTLQLFQFIGINVGTDAIPQYQDGAIRLNFPLKNGAKLSVFGIGGDSKIDIVLSEDDEVSDETLIYGNNDRDQYFTSRMGLVGATYTQPINTSAFLKIGIAASHSQVKANHDYMFRHIENDRYVVDSLPSILDYRFTENKYAAYAFINKKINRRLSLKTGINVDIFQLNYFDKGKTVLTDTVDGQFVFSGLGEWKNRWNSTDKNLLLQPYAQLKYRVNEKLTATAGLTALYYGINDNSFSPFEPRAGLSYTINEKQQLALGFGYHSQIQSNYLYYYGNLQADGSINTYNKDMGLSKSTHLVLSYDLKLGQKMRLKAETYYQWLANIPVTKGGEDYFSLINSGSGFSRLFPDELINNGTGRNYGVELTIEKFFSNHYYFLFTGSLYDSKYKGSNGVLANTSFNGNYAFNSLFGKEWKFKKSSFSVGGKITFAGGRWHGEVDGYESGKLQEVVYLQNDHFNSQQFAPYFRADAKINYRVNSKKLTHEFAIDLVNLFNTKNILTLSYVPTPDEKGNYYREEYQLGFLPLFFYRVDF